MDKLQVGTKVVVKDLEVGTGSGMYFFSSEMKEHAGEVMTIDKVLSNGYHLTGLRNYTFTDEMIDVYEDFKKSEVIEDVDGDTIKLSAMKDFKTRLENDGAILNITTEDGYDEVILAFNLEQAKEIQKYMNEFIELAESNKPVVKEMTLEEIEEEIGCKLKIVE